MRLLVTRPQPDADAQAAVLRALGHDAVIAPVLSVDVCDPGPILVSDAQALIVTSRNALRSLETLGLVEEMTPLPLIAVGEATAGLTRELGFEMVTSGPGTAEALVPLIRENCAPAKGPLIYLTGEKAAFDLEAPLEAGGFDVQRRVLYATRPVGTLDRQAIELIRSGALDGVVLMSPATARAYAALVQANDLTEATGRLTHYCLSANVAEGLAGLPGARSCVADRPTQDDLLALITREAANC